MNKKLYLLIILLMMTFCSFIYAEEYTVDVSLLNAYEDEPSMGSDGMLPTGKLIVNGKSAKLRVTFVPLDFMDFTGYLGEITVEGKPVRIISTYDETDKYNDPKTGTDDKVKGKSYPKVVEFPVNLKKDILNAVIYVPVMGELGYGEKKVRLKITYPIIKEKPTYYTVPVRLWNANEDTESMGDGSIQHMANIRLKDGEMIVYLGADKMEVSSLVSSLVNLYYDTGKGYQKAKTYSYTIKIEGDDNIRPEVLSFPLTKKQEFVTVLVDPKVDIMGDDPIRARLKFSFNEMKEIKKSEAELILKAEKNQDNRTLDYKYDRKVKLYADFDKEVEFKVYKLKGDEFSELSKKYKNVKLAYRLSALDQIDFIPYDKKLREIRTSYQPVGEMKVIMPIEKEGEFFLYEVEDAKPISYKKIDNFIEFTYPKLGTFVFDYKEKKEVKKEVKEEKTDAPKKKDNIIIQSEKKGVKKDSPFVILLFLIIVLPLLIGSIYLFNKYYKKLIRELLYAEELKIKLERRNK